MVFWTYFLQQLSFFFVTILFGTDLVHVYIGSMHGIFPYIYHKNQPNVGKYITHGSNGYMHKSNLPFSFAGFVPAPPKKNLRFFVFFNRTWQAYVEGINWYAKKGRLPLEFKLTQQPWEPWTVVPRMWSFRVLRCWCFFFRGEKNGANLGNV